jgi:hypothetical protein
MFFKRFWQIFSFKNCFTPHLLARKPERAKNQPVLKGSSANQIASFSLIKNKL